MAAQVALHGYLFLSTLPARGATCHSIGMGPIIFHFYPRSPRGERPAERQKAIAENHISIHAPREGSDRPGLGYPRRHQHFYPRSPRGERHSPTISMWSFSHFYPRSREGSDAEQYQATFGEVVISIHAPREGSDWARGHLDDVEPGDFYPRSPRGERPLMMMGL